MNKNICYYISIAILLSVFASCSKDEKDEPEVPVNPIPFLEITSGEPYPNGSTIKINGEAQTLSVFAHSNMKEVRVEVVETVWVEYKEMIRKTETDEIEFVFEIFPNPLDTERTGYIAISSPFGTSPVLTLEPKSITIVQAAAEP